MLRKMETNGKFLLMEVRNNTGIDALEFAKKMEESGAGELLGHFNG